MGNERSGNGHPPAIHEPGLYRIRVAGRLGREWADRVDGMAIRVQERGPDRTVTDLTGTVADQAALQGLLGRLYGRGFVLLGVELLSASDGVDQFATED